MKMQQVTFLLPPYGTATLSLPEVLTTDTFIRLEAAVNDVIGEQAPSVAAKSETDRGAIEFDSWLVNLR